MLLGIYVLHENSPEVAQAPQAVSVASLGTDAVALDALKSTLGAVEDPLAVAEKSAKFTLKLFQDSTFQQIEKLLTIDCIVFVLLYLVAWKLFNPTLLFADLVEKEQELPEMEGDDFVSTAVTLKKKSENSVGRKTEIKERFDELNKINDTWMDNLKKSWIPCTWYSLLREYDDVQVKNICGSDGALYIVYLRYSAYFFTLLSMGNGVLIYLYLTGDHKNLPNVMEAFTISAID